MLSTQTPGIATALTDITQELHNVQQQLQYWRVEADAWKARWGQDAEAMCPCQPGIDSMHTPCMMKH